LVCNRFNGLLHRNRLGIGGTFHHWPGGWFCAWFNGLLHRNRLGMAVRFTIGRAVGLRLV
jgi:hypothetical protein